MRWCAAVLLACWLASVAALKESTSDSAWEDNGRDGPVFAGVASTNYEKDYGGGYKDIQIVQGPVGPTGADGATGATGSKGDRGEQGPAGPPGKCLNCGICPEDTKSDFWELGDAEFVQPCPLCNDATANPNQCFLPTQLSVARATCDSDLQIGGACESFCIYYNGYTDLPCENPGIPFPRSTSPPTETPAKKEDPIKKQSDKRQAQPLVQGVFAVGYFPQSTFTTNGWAADGTDDGTYCSVLTDNQFYYDNSYYFVCGTFAWRKCCRGPNVADPPELFPWDGSALDTCFNAQKPDKWPEPTKPGQLKVLPQAVLYDVARYNLALPASGPTPPNGNTADLKPIVPCWVQTLLASKDTNNRFYFPSG